MSSPTLPEFSSDEFYRRLHAGNPGDVDFYVRASEGAASVLELGAGWGRVTGAVARTCPDVVGVEADAAFLKEARREVPAAVFAQGDMRSFDLERRFDRILIPYNSLYCLAGQAGVRACFERVVQHLQPEGELFFDCYPMDDFHQAALDGDVPPDKDEVVAEWDFASGPISVVENTRLVPDEQRLEVSYRALTASGSLAGEHQISHAYLLSGQLFELLEASNLAPVLAAGSFDGAPWDAEAEQLIVGAELTK